MPLQNRVTPLGDLVADPGRGLVYGNRGCLHDASGRIRRHHNGKRWIACQLEFRGWQRATAAAARSLHRAVLSRRGDRVRRRPSTVRALPPRGLRALRRGLACAASWPDRSGRRRRAASPRTRCRRHERPAPSRGLARRAPRRCVRPVGRPAHLVLGSSLLTWSAAGYVARRPRPSRTQAVVITPPSLAAVLRSGWQPLVPLLHPTALTA